MTITMTNDMYIAGLPAFRIRRAFLAAGVGRTFIWPLCADHLIVSPSKALSICERLVKEEYLFLDQDSGHIKIYKRTAKTRRFLKEIMPTPLTTAEADVLVTSFIAFCRDINSMPENHQRIRSVELIGEALTDLSVPHLEFVVQLDNKPHDDSRTLLANSLLYQGDVLIALEKFHPSVCVRQKFEFKKNPKS